MSNNINNLEQNEKDLVVRLKKGQEAAYQMLIRQYQAKLLYIAYGITLDSEESREIVQEVFIKVFKSIHSFRGDSKLFTWLRRITVNESLNWQRKLKRRFKWHHQSLEKEDTYDIVEDKSDMANPELLVEKKELKKDLEAGLKSLPEDARTVFILKEVEGLSYEEIARILDIQKGTVSSRLFYARQKLRSILFDRGTDR